MALPTAELMSLVLSCPLSAQLSFCTTHELLRFMYLGGEPRRSAGAGQAVFCGLRTYCLTMSSSSLRP